MQVQTLSTPRFFNPVLAGGLGLVGGLWLIVSPYLFGYNNLSGTLREDGEKAALAGIITGILALGLSALALASGRSEGLHRYRRAAGISLVVLGLVMMACPFLFDLTLVKDALWNLQLTGAAFILIAGFLVQSLIYRDEI